MAPRTGRRRSAPALAAVLLSWLVAPLPADVIHLKNGSRVEGEVSEATRPGYIRVMVDRGIELEFPSADIREIEKKKSPAREFDERLLALKPDDIDGLLLLAEWARERQLRSKVEQVCRRVLDLDPNEPVARRELGYVVFRNRWVKESELRGKHGLIQFRGDWVTPEEKERRIQEELKKEIADLLSGVETDNLYIREYSIRKLLEYRDPRAGGVLLGFLADRREAVRAVALQALAAVCHPPATSARLKASGKGPRGAAESATGPSEDDIARALLDRVLAEESPAVRQWLARTLQKMQPRRLFELALETVQASENPLHRSRAAEGIYFALRKGSVPELIRALGRRPPGVHPSIGGNPDVRSLLVRVFTVDFEYRVEAWEAFWAKNQSRYRDE